MESVVDDLESGRRLWRDALREKCLSFIFPQTLGLKLRGTY